MIDQAVLEVLAEQVRAEFVSPDAPPVDGDQLLQDVAAFIGRYLQCSREQLHLLALWVLHTYCLDVAQVTPFLAIQSTEKQAGKTLCLQLLKLLCNDAGLTAGFTLSKLTQWTDTGPRTLLLDECQAVIGTRNRSKSPALRAVLASGFHKGLGYTENFCQRDIFCAKAFAGQGPLPEELADRSLTIILKPIRSGVVHEARVAQPPSAVSCTASPETSVSEANQPSLMNYRTARFDLIQATADSKVLQKQLRTWARQNLPDLEDLEPFEQEALPAHLTLRQQDMCEPLFSLADKIGGPWPQRIGEAVDALFQEEADFQLRWSVQLLEDLHGCFAGCNYPERLSTAMVLEWMQTVGARPWDVDGRMTGYRLAQLLSAFEIRPRVQRMAKGKESAAGNTVRGYRLEDFEEHWKRHFNLQVPAQENPVSQESKMISPDLASGTPMACNLSPVASLEIANKDKGCNTVSLVGEGPLFSPPPQDAEVPEPVFLATNGAETRAAAEKGRKSSRKKSKKKPPRKPERPDL